MTRFRAGIASLRRPPRTLLLGALWGALNWLFLYGIANRWVPATMNAGGSWVRALPVVHGLEHLFLWPSRAADRLFAMVAPDPYNALPYQVQLWVWPLAIVTGAVGVWLVGALWSAAGARRGLVALLVGALALPAFHQAFVDARVRSRLFPAGVEAFHNPAFMGSGHLQYSDLAPAVRERISESEFNAWRTWADVAASFEKAQLPGVATSWSAWHFYSVEPHRGDELGRFSFDPLTGKLVNVSFERWHDTADVTVLGGGYSGGKAKAVVKNWGGRPVRLTSAALGTQGRVIPLDLRLQPGAQTELTFELNPAELGAGFRLTWETGPESHSHTYQLFGP